MSFFANYGSGPTLHHRVLEMWDGDHSNDNNRNLQLGYSDFTGVGTTVGNTRNMGIQVHDSNSNTNINQDLVGAPTFLGDSSHGGATHLFVMRFDLSNSGNDRIRVYLDPLGTSEPGTANADVSVGEFLADRMGAITDFVFGDSAKAAAFDELRVGTTFADVANLHVPEPASIVLFGLGAIGLASMVRRKRA
jgi:hypothetical protein